MNRDEFITAVAKEYCRSSSHRDSVSQCKYGEQAAHAALTVLQRLHRDEIFTLLVLLGVGR